MTISTVRIRSKLTAFDFKTLFIEELGWDRFSSPLPIEIDGTTFTLQGVAEKRNVVVLVCPPAPDGNIPLRPIRDRIERLAAKTYRQHIIIFVDEANQTQTWQWVKRERGTPDTRRELTLYPGQGGEAIAQTLRSIAFTLNEEDAITHTDVNKRLSNAFSPDQVTNDFYKRFKNEHNTFIKFIEGLAGQSDREWYASLMLNRLMFIYFVQKKEFLDGDPNYLRNRLRLTQERRGNDQFLSFYRHFLLRLFHQGLGSQERSPELDALLGRVPYLNGGLFDVHQLEREHPNIQIPDEAFEKIFDFFDDWRWHLDERPLRDGKDINPDVLGYIFEKYVNQKQMGAYYTKEDITEYISRNTVVPFLLDSARRDCAIAFRPDGAVWGMLQENPDRYIFEAMRTGMDKSLPPDIAAGLNDVSQRGGWNRPAAECYALPTETWREHVARRRRYEEVWNRLVDGEIHEVNDLITYNLDIRQFAQDAIQNSEGPELLRAFWKAIESVTILDPTCGSGAFLFAALNILEPLYDACLDRMEVFLDELDHSDEKHSPAKFSDFRKTLHQVAQHPNRRYFILKSIILNNLYGVDIMEEAVEICKLRLFLKLMAQAETGKPLEPLPDIDFNIRAGNSLVGFATYDEVRRSVLGFKKLGGSGNTVQNIQSKMDFGGDMSKLDEAAESAALASRRFHEMQTAEKMDAKEFAESKQDIRRRLSTLNDDLDRYLASQYGIDKNNISDTRGYDEAFHVWKATHQPFHWFAEFYETVSQGGFDVIIGNPPYVEYTKVKNEYTVLDYETEACRNLYAFTLERSKSLMQAQGRYGFIIPVSFAAADAFASARSHILSSQGMFWMSHFANRPGQLFSGAQNRLTILLHCACRDKGTVMTTRYQRWDEQHGGREALFALITYLALEDIFEYFHGLIPKVGTPEALSVLEKMRRPKRLRVFAEKSAAHHLYWVRVPGYFCQFYLEPPKARLEKDGTEKIRGEVNSVATTSESLQRLLHALLNSSTYYHFFSVHSDGRHINPSDVLDFPIDLDEFNARNARSLIQLSYQLEMCMKRNVKLRRKSGLIIDSVDSKGCKHILDEIDLILASHYGLTNFELDVIVHHDYKFRMGLNNNDEEAST